MQSNSDRITQVPSCIAIREEIAIVNPREFAGQFRKE
jgi:hypothetical protein